MKKLFYTEFLLPIKDYFSTLKLNEFIFEWFVPGLLSVLIYLYIIDTLKPETIKQINGYVINCLAILIGFSVTCLTILSTNSSKNVEDLKDVYSERYIDGHKVSLHQLIIINFIFLLVIEFFNLIYNLSFVIFVNTSFATKYMAEFYSFSIFITAHVIFLNVRNVTNFYLVFTRQQ